MPLRALISLLLAVALLVASGCALFGVAAATIVPEPKVPIKYDLAGKSIGVIVWADRRLRIDYPAMQQDIANGITLRLKDAQTKKAKSLKESTFPVEYGSILKYQRDYPDTEFQPITEYAGKFGVERLIYVEIVDFSTRSDASVELFRGKAKFNIKLIEIDSATKTAVVGYQEDNLTTYFPRRGPEDGSTTGSDVAMYGGTAREITDEVMRKFVAKEAKD